MDVSVSRVPEPQPSLRRAIGWRAWKFLKIGRPVFGEDRYAGEPGQKNRGRLQIRFTPRENLEGSPAVNMQLMKFPGFCKGFSPGLFHTIVPHDIIKHHDFCWKIRISLRSGCIKLYSSPGSNSLDGCWPFSEDRLGKVPSTFFVKVLRYVWKCTFFRFQTERKMSFVCFL